MTVLFDTSVLVAALDTGHPEHVRAAACWQRARDGSVRAVVSAHTLAELFVSFTKAPATTPAGAARVRDRIASDVLPHCQVYALSAADYRDLLDAAVSLQIRGATVYDAIHAKVAELAGCDELVTLNLRHFRRVWPGPPAAVVEP